MTNSSMHFCMGINIRHFLLNLARGAWYGTSCRLVEDHWAASVPVPLRAGGAAFWLPRTIHGSASNTSQTPRKAILCGTYSSLCLLIKPKTSYKLQVPPRKLWKSFDKMYKSQVIFLCTLARLAGARICEEALVKVEPPYYRPWRRAEKALAGSNTSDDNLSGDKVGSSGSYSSAFSPTVTAARPRL